jgi:hypothetical protein
VTEDSTTTPLAAGSSSPATPAEGLVRVLEQHPEGVQGLPGYVWLDMPGKVRSVGEQELEFSVEPPDCPAG